MIRYGINKTKNILKMLYLFVIWNEELLEWEIKIKTKKSTSKHISKYCKVIYKPVHYVRFNFGPKI